MKELEYPFDSQYLLRKRKSLKRTLLEKKDLIPKKIAILGGSTTHDIKDMLELFLLNLGFIPSFYESEYAQYWQDAMFDNEELKKFGPDIIFIHTSNRNILQWPEISDSVDEVDEKLRNMFNHFKVMWEKLSHNYDCPIIQNNFEYPFFRIKGNKDASDYTGRINFVTRLNQLFYDYAQKNSGLFINDINWQSADYGLKKWSDPVYWYMYKYSLNLDAIPSLAFNVASIIKSIFGKNKKALAIDLDNTLWGGIVGDDGVENLEIGQETSNGQAYQEFQYYLKELQKHGIILNVISKNDYENAIAGLEHPQMLLRPNDFIEIKANWEPKSINLVNMAQELTLLPESFVFLDDNPAEREIIRQQVAGVALPILDQVDSYITAVDRANYFEVTNLSADDLKRNEMYKENIKRAELQNSFSDYGEYLLSLDMKAEIEPFSDIYMARIAQLTNKSNQFNLTTRRYTQEEITEISGNSEYITLYGKLVDCFGDNGVVALTIGQMHQDECDIILWLMSCRVLKRDMEFAMMDELVRICKKNGIKQINGFYYPTAKNSMVKDFYEKQGFTKISEDSEGNTKWTLILDEEYANKNKVIKVNGGEL